MLQIIDKEQKIADLLREKLLAYPGYIFLGDDFDLFLSININYRERMLYFFFVQKIQPSRVFPKKDFSRNKIIIAAIYWRIARTQQFFPLAGRDKDDKHDD